MQNSNKSNNKLPSNISNNKPNNTSNNTQPVDEQPLENNKKNNTQNNKKNIQNNTKNIQKNKNGLNFTNSNKREEERKQILDILNRINTELGSDIENEIDQKEVVKLTIKLFKIMTDEQGDIVKRQKIIDTILRKYDEILKDYDNKSFRLDKLEQIMKSVSQLNVPPVINK